MIAHVLSTIGGISLILILVGSVVIGAYFLSGAFYPQEDSTPTDNCFYDGDVDCSRSPSEGEENQ